MADVQILRAPTTGVPSNYTLPDAAELLLKMVYAEFDGSGAGGSWCPCVTLLSDSGDVLGRAVDVANPVAAGGSADVTFFPRLRSGAAAAAGGAAGHDILSLIRNPAVQAIPSPAGAVVTYGNVTGTTKYTNAAGDWTFTLDGGGNITTVNIVAVGVYLVRAHATWGAVTGNYDKILALACTSFLPDPPLNQAQFDRTFDTTTTEEEASVIFPVDAATVAGGGGTVQVSVSQNSGAPVNLIDSLLQIVRLGTTFP